MLLGSSDAFDKVDVVGHAGVDSRILSLGAAVSPGNDSDQSERVAGEEGAARIALARVLTA